MVVNKKERIDTEVPGEALIALFLIVCLLLLAIGDVGLVRLAGAKLASEEGWLVFVRDNDIWVMNADGANQEQLTVTEGYEYTPTWSPDASQIAFSRRLDDASLGDIYIMNADGTNVRQLTKGPEDDGHPTWSPDGKWIAFERIIWEKKGDNWWEHISSAIYVIGADGLDMNILTDGDPLFFARSPAWSPDGSKIAFHQYMPSLEPHRLWLMQEDGTNQELLLDWGDSPSWSPDGQKIAFSSTEAREKNWESYEIYVMNANGSDVKKLTGPDLSCEECPSWSPDGTKIVFDAMQDDNCDIYIMNADGSNVQRITNTPEHEFWPDWTAFSYAVDSVGKLETMWGKIKAK